MWLIRRIYRLSKNGPAFIFGIILFFSLFSGTFFLTAQATTINTSFSSITITPNAAAFGQNITIKATISPSPPSGYSYYGIILSVIDSNGNYRTIGFSNKTQPGTGTFYLSWIPDIRGTYKCIIAYPGETLAGNTYTSCQRNSSFTVGNSSPTATPTPSPVPTTMPTPTQVNVETGQTQDTPIVLWYKPYNSNGAYDAIRTSDGGYAIVSPSDGGYFLVKFDSDGNVKWNRNYSYPKYAVYPKSVVQTSDGGYAIVGWAQSLGVYAGHVWLVKTNSNGDMLWNKMLGDDQGVSEGNCLIQTSDGGFAITGDYGGFNGYSGPGGWNFLFLKTDSEGNLQWTKIFGEKDDDRATSLIQTSDGGYALVGCTSIPGNIPMFWLVKTDISGNKQWAMSFAEASGWSYSVIQTKDGGYALVGTAGGWSGSTGPINLVKTDSLGSMQWISSIGKTMSWATSVIQTSDGGYAVTGGGDFQLAKTDAHGKVQWTYIENNAQNGGAACKVIQNPDGTYLLAGEGYSGITKLSDRSPAEVPKSTDNLNGVTFELNFEQQSVLRDLPWYLIGLVVVADTVAVMIFCVRHLTKRK